MKAVTGRRLSSLIAVLAFAALLVPVANSAKATTHGGSGSSASNTVVPLATLYVRYQNNCTFSVFNDAGQPVSSIAPGKYQVDVSTPIMFKLLVPGGTSSDNVAANDFTGCKGWVQFQMNGPGVSLFTTLDSGCDSNDVLGAFTFQPSSTYTLQDLNQPTVTKMALTTAATGTPAVPKTSPYDKVSGKGQTSQDIVGSDILQGTLKASLSAAGKLTLTRNGLPVSKLAAGKWKFQVTDLSAKGSVTIKTPGETKVLTSSKFTGKHTVTVMLSTGKWSYFSGAGKLQTFRVS
jgi:hypothetical protein